MRLKTVDLPAPFGPMRLRISSGRTWKSRFSTADRPPNLRVSLRVSSSGAGAESAILDLARADRIELGLFLFQRLLCLRTQFASTAPLRPQTLRAQQHDAHQDESEDHGLGGQQWKPFQPRSDRRDGAGTVVDGRAERVDC